MSLPASVTEAFRYDKCTRNIDADETWDYEELGLLHWTQVTAQDISTMLRCEQKSIIFLINNGGYTIEVEIHDGPYNVIKNWNYTALVDSIHNGEGKCWTTKVNSLASDRLHDLSRREPTVPF